MFACTPKVRAQVLTLVSLSRKNKRRASLLAVRHQSSAALLSDKLAPYSIPRFFRGPGSPHPPLPKRRGRQRWASGRGSFPFGLDFRGREFLSLLIVLHGHFIVFLKVLELGVLVVELDFCRLLDFELKVLAILVGENKFHFV